MKSGITIPSSLDIQGYCLLDKRLTPPMCDELVSYYDHDERFRSTIDMARYKFGQGEYRYFDYPLPAPVAELRGVLYGQLAPIANEWMSRLAIDIEYPEDLETFLEECHKAGQKRPTPLILQYGPGCYNTLHQDLYGDVFFPFQAIVALSEPDTDYTGGELLLTEQKPRMQSKGVVLRPNKGQIAIITNNFRPVQGTRGYYRANMRHGVAEVNSGSRYTLGIIFHDGK